MLAIYVANCSSITTHNHLPLSLGVFSSSLPVDNESEEVSSSSATSNSVLIFVCVSYITAIILYHYNYVRI